MLTSIDHVWGICVTNRRSTFSQWGPGGGVLDHPSNEHQYFPPPPHHSRALNERLPSQNPARLYVRPSRQQLPPWIQLQLCNNMFWHFFRGWGVIIGLAISRHVEKSTFCDMSTVDKFTVFFYTPPFNSDQRYTKSVCVRSVNCKMEEIPSLPGSNKAIK